MSIIYNGKVVAGVYEEQIIQNADTVNEGIIKIATQEEVNAGTDNTTAVTPLYLAQKQDKLTTGDNIEITPDNKISCLIKPDNTTIVQNNDGTIVATGQKTKSNTIKFDWEGTTAEYQQAWLNGDIEPDWYCYITDDEAFADLGDALHKNLDNLTPDGEDKLNVSKMYITGVTPSSDTKGYNQLLELYNDGVSSGLDIIDGLTIPYTLSKTGSKIVEATHRDKIQQLYEQTGVAPYYTIDIENQNFTLPMGEIYGMLQKLENKQEGLKEEVTENIQSIQENISNVANRDLSNLTENGENKFLNSESTPHITETYQSDTSWYRVYSDGWCEQGGYYPTSSATTTVTLLKPYKDTNYNAQVTWRRNASTDNYGPIVNINNVSTFIVYHSSAGAQKCGGNWFTQGYIN